MPNLNKAFQWWINTCNAPRIAYSQTYRNQVYLPQYDVTCYDCSSFVWYGLMVGGFDCVAHNTLDPPTWPFTTGDRNNSSECSCLRGLGFTQLSPSNTPPMRGDILWKVGHTEIVYDIDPSNSSVAQTMGAHSYGPPVHPDLGSKPLPDQVSINPYFDSMGQWERMFRLGAGGASGYGYSPYVIAALCGNAWRESTINSGLHQVGGNAFGMFQWDGGRKTNLLNWLSQHGYSSDDPIGQLEFLIDENDWIADSESRSLGINSLTDFLSSSVTDIHQLTRLFCNCWERPGVPAMQDRYDAADRCYSYFTANANNGEINQWYISNTYLTTEQSLNNSVMLYNYFSTGGGGGWPNGMPPRYKHKMPVWMMTRKIYC